MGPKWIVIICQRCMWPGETGARLQLPSGPSAARREPQASVRKRLRDEQGNRCAYCNREFGPLVTETIDHVVPLSKGGGKGISNLVLACRRCNSRKGNRSVEEFLADLEESEEAKA
jgi:5-methylcytosine-specific restriction endonuclease McrA